MSRLALNPGHNTFLVHESFMDVFIEVQRVIYRKGYTELHITWWNLGFTGTPWEIDRGRIEIQDKNLDEWKYFDPDKPETHPGR